MEASPVGAMSTNVPDRPQYVYKPLTGEDEIRLLVLQPSQLFSGQLHGSFISYHRQRELARVDDFRPYSAVSYTWGSLKPSESTLFIVCKDDHGSNSTESILIITPTVDSLLRHLRKGDKPVYLWLDALCISQTDQDEKASQIPQMGEIFKSAKKVHVWLGDDNASAASAFATFRQYATYGDLFEPNPANLEGMRSIFKKPWFFRRWTLQEAALAQRTIFHCGKYTSEMSHLVAAAHHLTQKAAYYEIPEYGPKTILALAGSRERHFTLLDMLWRFDESECEEKKDRVAALLGFLSPSESLSWLNYNQSWETIFLSLARHCIAMGAPSTYLLLTHVLAFGTVASSKHWQKRNPVSTYPGWVPDWSRGRSRLPFFSEAMNPELMPGMTLLKGMSGISIDPHYPMSYDEFPEAKYADDDKAFITLSFTLTQEFSTNHPLLEITCQPYCKRYFCRTVTEVFSYADCDFSEQSTGQPVIRGLGPLRGLINYDERARYLLFVFAAVLVCNNVLPDNRYTSFLDVVNLVQHAIHAHDLPLDLTSDHILVLQQISFLLEENVICRIKLEHPSFLETKPGLDEFRSEYGLGPKGMQPGDLLLSMSRGSVRPLNNFGIDHRSLETMICLRSVQALCPNRQEAIIVGSALCVLAMKLPGISQAQVYRRGVHTFKDHPRLHKFIVK
ncbi:heterokaryon incompatibility protein-domain-containing protein [Xylariomycetidae sp. FL2044]|nr:heterokaryon incompatibility protein-domain-containing protein [Xylariomycetidae sp. FL2044]